jgi:SAM-dependent methyltransferase
LEDLDRLKKATAWMWSLGDYTEVAPRLEPSARQLVRALDLGPGACVLDVAAGNGNFALAAAEQGATVTASDLTPRMVELGRERSRQAGYEGIDWVEADAEQLPFDDSQFDVVASVFGAMFAPQPERVAREMFRVCRPGGVVAMANYGHAGFLSAIVRMFSKYSARPSFELPSPFDWGEPDVVRQRFAELAGEIDVRPQALTMEFESVEAGVGFWERTNGPMAAMRTMLPPERYAQVRADLADLMHAMNHSRGARLEVKASYVEVLARK